MASAALSTIFGVVQNNFADFYAGPQPVSFYFGPEWKAVQSGPAQVVAFPIRDRFGGPEAHFNPPGQPRELRRAWTKVLWMIWSDWAPLVGWSPSTTVAQGAVGAPSVTNQNGYYYTASTGGETGPTEPTWPTTIGQTVNDGSVVWTCTGTTIAYTASKTDNTELIKAALIQAIHAGSVGAYHLLDGEWYSESDQFAMRGTLYVLATEFWIPAVDAAEGLATVTKAPITAKLT